MGLLGPRGQGKTFSMGDYARTCGHRYGERGLRTTIAAPEIQGPAKCPGKPRGWGAQITADGSRSKSDAGWTMRHHVHNLRDCTWCKGMPHEGHGYECATCDLEECDRPLTARVSKTKDGALYCKLSDAEPV